MAQQGNPNITVNLDVQRLADAITNRNDLFVLIPNRYEGDPRKFREWVKQIEKYVFMTELDAAKVKLIAYKTSSGPVSDLIERYITNTPNNTKRERYTGEEGHKICLQRMYHAFSIAYKNLKLYKKRWKNYANRNIKPIDFEVGNAVLLINHRKKSKIDSNWLPYYRIVARHSPLAFVVKNVLTDHVVRSHANNLKHANLENWEISNPNHINPEANADPNQRPKRKATYVVPPSDSSDSEVSSGETEIYDHDPDSLMTKFRFERTDSSSLSEDDVPLEN